MATIDSVWDLKTVSCSIASISRTWVSRPWWLRKQRWRSQSILSSLVTHPTPPRHPCPQGPVIYHMANGRAVFPTQPRSRCLPQYNLSKRQIEFAAMSLVLRRRLLLPPLPPEPLGMTVIINTLVQTLIKMATNCRGAGPFGGGGCQWCDRTAFLVNDITCLRGWGGGGGCQPAEAQPPRIDVLSPRPRAIYLCKKKSSFSTPNSWRASCVIEFFARLPAVFFFSGRGVRLSAESGGSTLQRKERGEKKGTVAIQFAFIGEKALTAGKTRGLILQRAHPWPVKAELIHSFSGRKALRSRKRLSV